MRQGCTSWDYDERLEINPMKTRNTTAKMIALLHPQAIHRIGEGCLDCLKAYGR